MKDTPLQTHQVNISKNLLLRQNLLFDTNSLVNIIDYRAEALLEELKNDLFMTFITINPVLVELYNTNNPTLRLQRQLMVTKNNIKEHPLIKRNFEDAREIQIWSAERKCFPHPTDLYLGSKLAEYSTGAEKVYLLSGDLKDFPRPLFKREGHVILLEDKSSLLLTILSIDMRELKNTQSSVKKRREVIPNHTP